MLRCELGVMLTKLLFLVRYTPIRYGRCVPCRAICYKVPIHKQRSTVQHTWHRVITYWSKPYFHLQRMKIHIYMSNSLTNLKIVLRLIKGLNEGLNAKPLIATCICSRGPWMVPLVHYKRTKGLRVLKKGREGSILAL